MAAAAVEMVRPDRKIIPDQLITALGLEILRRKLLATFLAHLRKQLAGSDSFSPLIDYANDLDQRGSLAGLTFKVDLMARDGQLIKSLMEQWTAHLGLTENDTKALEDYLTLCRERLSHRSLPMVRKNVGRFSPWLKLIFVPLCVRDEKAEEAARKAAQKRVARTRPGCGTWGTGSGSGFLCCFFEIPLLCSDRHAWLWQNHPC